MSDSSLNSYEDDPPGLVPMEITEDTMMEVDRRLYGGSRPEGTDSVRLQNWLILYWGGAVLNSIILLLM